MDQSTRRPGSRTDSGTPIYKQWWIYLAIALLLVLAQWRYLHDTRTERQRRENEQLQQELRAERIRRNSEPAIPREDSIETMSDDDEMVQLASLLYGRAGLASGSLRDGKGRLAFKPNPRRFSDMEDVRKFFAIESARLFHKLATLQELTMTVPYDDRTYRAVVSRKAIEINYHMAFDSLSNRAWRSDFLAAYDNPLEHRRFAAKFVR